ncbi:MAG: hypothetical protein BroJett031_23570 [Betaproteobacteria bacterium]|nr:MAG: hypothetical protein BroJett031_23570 [Betaproteobacteria bacterium]
MGLFSSTPEERAEKERQKAEEAKRKAEAEFAASPPGQARAAREAGATIFQIDLPLSKTRGFTVPLTGAYAITSASTNHSNLIQAIENEGWRLEHVGYVYRIRGSVSRDKFLASGQQEAVDGEIVGVYLFRAS